MTNAYNTITGRKLDLLNISESEKGLLREALIRVRTDNWNRFGAWWPKAFNDSGLSEDSPVFRICCDLESRLGIDEGRVSPPDYRDYLADLIEERFGSRSRLPAP